MLEAAEADLSRKHGLTKLRLRFKLDEQYEGDSCKHDEAVLEGLKPHSNLRRLDISRYRGQKLPSWAGMNNLCITLPNLVYISLLNCESCREVPSMSQLPFLKHLQINKMESVEYMERNISSSSLFFPSLQVLVLRYMKKLKGWWKEEAMESHTELEGASYEMGGQLVPKFMQMSKLSKLTIYGCRNLRMLPLCPNLEDLELKDNNELASVLEMVTTVTMSNSSYFGPGLRLNSLVIDNVEHLMSLPSHCLQQLSSLQISSDWRLKLEGSQSKRLGEVFETLSSSLRTLHFFNCHNLRSISKVLEHLTALENLKLAWCDNLDITGNEEDGGIGMPWKTLNTSLRFLFIFRLHKLLSLPSGLQHLSNLRTLILSCIDELKELPEWISCLTSLTNLELNHCHKLKSLPAAICNLTTLNQLKIKGCLMLTERCQCPNGSDWSKIQHIPYVKVTD